MNDTLSPGLDYEDITSIKIGTKDLVEGTDYTVTVDDGDKTEIGTKIKIVFKNFLQYATSQPGADIVVTMTAKVNQNAVIGNSGNPNKVNLQYSNNPNVDYNGTDEPVGDEVIGQTPDDTVITYLTGIQITKKDATDKTPLAGAKFQITGTSLTGTLVTQQEYVLDNANGTYYKLKDGSYTTEEPNDETRDQYENTDEKYKLDEITKWVPKTEEVEVTAVTGPDGIIKFSGLGAGTYTIKELEAPDGYNKIAKDITVTIDAYNAAQKLVFEGDVVSTGNETITWKSSATGEVTYTETEATNGEVSFDVENSKGATLPSTGGIGTTIFYVLGAILAIGAGILLVTKKRMNADK